MTATYAASHRVTDDPRQARHALGEVLASWGFEQLTDDLELVVSELVTNAIRHGGGVRNLTLSAQNGAVRVVVGDYSTVLPTPRTAAESDIGGRGMTLIGALCSRWGAELDGDGKIVWAELAGDVG